MKDVNVLLFDLCPSSSLGADLQAILETSQDLNVQSKEVSSRISDISLLGKELYCVNADFNPDVIFLVLSPSHLKNPTQLHQCFSKDLHAQPIIVVVQECEPDEMAELLNIGVADFITPPLKAFDILPRIWRTSVHWRQKETLTWTMKEKLGLKQLVGKSPTFLEAVNKIPLVARCDASVLIAGETGTGKEWCARAIHYLSPRANRPFVPVACGAIPTDLMENELFGHVRGAFTDASIAHSGLIQEADGGTMFLDDIDCLPLLAQVKLLRFLQEKEYRQLGSTKMQKADVRVVAATNLDLEEAAIAGTFRQDLYYRLNVILLALPPLRERREDIPRLAQHFLAKYSEEFDKPITGFTSGAIERLVRYEWPGNVRELEHLIERALVLSEEPVIRRANIVLPQTKIGELKESFQEAKTRVINQFERSYIQGLLAAHQGNITRAANTALKNRRAFWQLIRKHRIDVQQFKAG
jgi:two-component system response regulator GlrR